MLRGESEGSGRSSSAGLQTHGLRLLLACLCSCSCSQGGHRMWRDTLTPLDLGSVSCLPCRRSDTVSWTVQSHDVMIGVGAWAEQACPLGSLVCCVV